jgi:phosphoribosyl 1,2-cyclic phosphate phosphodiesterase
VSGTGRITILGCGSSGGVPRVGPSGWGACDPKEPKNRRRRCSILVEREGPGGLTSVIVDMGPDLREQLIDADVQNLDAALLTHGHADHIHGIDDVRPLVISHRRRIDTWMDEPTSRTVRQGFGYIFETPAGSNYPPLLTERRLTPGESVAISGHGGELRAMPFRLEHGEIDALGFRFGNVAYTPDVIGVPNESLPYLQGLDVWIIDALRHAPHPSHFSLSQALDWIQRMAPKRAVLTNLHSDLDYATLAAELPERVRPAYDGMRIEWTPVS